MKLLVLLLLLPAFALAQTSTTISALPAAPTLTGAETFACESNGTKKCSVSQVATYTLGVTGVLPVTNGGNGTSTPALTAGSNITLSGTWPNYTITAAGSTLPSIPTQTILGNGSGITQPASALTLGGNLVATATGLTTAQLFNLQTGTSYTIQASDSGKAVQVCNASSIAVTFPTTLGAGFDIDFQNAPNPAASCSGAGTATVTPSSGTINGAASLAVAFNRGCEFTLVSGSTDIKATACTALDTGGSSSGASFTSTVTAAVPTGGNDWGASPPSGYTAGTTNRLILTPTDSTSALTGLLAAPDGWTVLVINAGTGTPITFAPQAAGTSTNSFWNPNNINNILTYKGTMLLSYSTALGGWVMLGATPAIANGTLLGNSSGGTHSPQQLTSLPFPSLAQVPVQTQQGFGFNYYAEPLLAPLNPSTAACSSYDKPLVITIGSGSTQNTYPHTGVDTSVCTGSTYSTTAYPTEQPGMYESDLDVIVNCPTTPLTVGIHFYGGRNWIINGCAFAASGGASGAVSVAGASGIVYLEGIYSNTASTGFKQDFIDISGRTNNARVTGITGNYTSGQYYITSLSSVTGILPGDTIGGPGFGSAGLNQYAQVVAVNPSGCTAPCLQLNRPTTASQTGQSLAFFTTHYPTLIMQNSNSNGVVGASSLHADGVLQVQGPLSGLCLYNVTGRGNYNMLNIDSQAPIGFANITNTNMDFQTGVPNGGTDAFTPILLNDFTSGAIPAWQPMYPVTFTNVYAETGLPLNTIINVVPGYSNPSQYGVYASTATNGATQGSVISFPAIDNVNGVVIAGDPPNGDFSTNTNSGTNYTVLPNLGNLCGGRSAGSVASTGSGTVNSGTSGQLAYYAATGAAVSGLNTTGSGNAVLATSPTLVTPALGTPASGVLTNATGLPLSTGVTGTLSATNGGTGEAGTITGVLKGNGTSAYTAAASSDVIALWSGTCNSSSYLNGAGACATPSGSGSVLTPPQGRLSLSSANAVQNADVTAATTIYYLPYAGNTIPVYNGTAFVQQSIGSSISLSTANATNFPANAVMDVYAFMNSGTLTLCATPWGTPTIGASARGGSAGVALYGGIWTNSGAWSCYAAGTTYTLTTNQATLLGTIAITATAQQMAFQMSPAAASGGPTNGCWMGYANVYNPVPMTCTALDNAGSWTSTVTSWEALHVGGTGSGLYNRVTFVDPLGLNNYTARLNDVSASATSGSAVFTAIGVNSVTTASGAGSYVTATTKTPSVATWSGPSPQTAGGLNYVNGLDQSTTSITATFIGNGASSVQVEALQFTGNF